MFSFKRSIVTISALMLALVVKATEAEKGDSIPGASLPEVNIVAIKQSSSLENQPVSATVLGRTQIQQDRISDIKNISDVVPNFFIPVYGSRITSSIYVRGIGARMDQPSVGLTIDNMPVLNKDAYDLYLPDISEVEMLRGPQSSLYGRNTMTGLINIRTLSPFAFGGWRLKAALDTRFGFQLAGGYYHAFSRKFALSVNASIASVKGDFKNQYNGSDVGSEKTGSIRVKAEWRPTDALTVLNTFSTSISRQSGYAYENVASGEINYNDTCFYRRFLLNDALTLNYRFPTWEATGVFSLQRIADNMTLDQDFLPLSYFTLTQMKQETDFTAELLARSTTTDRLYNWMGGVFTFARHFDMQAPVTFKRDGIYNLIEHYRNDANPYYPIIWDSDQFPLNSLFSLPSFSFAAYHESTFKVNDFTFTGAIRLDYERTALHFRSFTDTRYTIYSNPGGDLSTPQSFWIPQRQVNLVIDDAGDLSTHFLTLLPKVSVLYRLPSELGNVYATFGKGYKAGGYNTQMFSDVLQQKLMSYMGLSSKYDVDQVVKYKPEYCFNYEVGSHLDFRSLSSSSLLNLQCDISLFYIDCRDQQLTTFPDGNTTGRIMTNAGRTRSFGGELSVRWRPYSPFEFIGNYGFTNARFLEYDDGKQDYAGKRVPYAPSNTLFLQALYTLQNSRLKNKSIIFDVNLRSAGNIYWNEANSISQPFYSLLGASVTLKAPKWELQVWGRNLTSTKYYTFYFMSIGNEFLQRGPGVRAGIDFNLYI